jgi:sugar (pentulose or hexulose) kinase
VNTEKKFIAFDLGAESGRCIVATIKDRRIDLKEVHRFTTQSVRYGKGFYWDILGISQEVIRGLVEARKCFGPRFDGIGVDTWGVDYVLVDSEGIILGYPHHYRDDRTDGVMADAFKIVSKDDMYRKVGIQFAQFNTLFQLLSENKRKLNFLTLADKMLLMPDFVNYLLSGKINAEFTIASTTSLADPIRRDWAWDLIERFELPKKVFPKIVEPGTVLGNLNRSLAESTKLNQNIPIIATAGHDTASAVVSVPADGINDWAFLSSGTWSLLGKEIDKPLLTSRAMEYNFTNEGGVGGTTRFLKNIIGLWPLQECRRYWSEKSDQYTYSALTELASREGFVKAWVDLNDSRFLKPDDMPNKILAYLKESSQSTKSNIGFIVNVILESLAFSYRMTKKEIEDVTGTKIQRLFAVGGGIQNQLLMQMTADALGCPVLAGPIEGAVIGNVGVQAVAAGAVSNITEWRSIVADSFQQQIYEPKQSDYFNLNEKAFREILSRGSLGKD